MAPDLIPLMRASVIQGNLADLDRLGAETVEEIRSGMSPRVLEAVERASRVAWLPLAHDLELSANAARVIGQVRRVEWSRTSMLRSLRTPLLEPLWKAAFRVFGISPGALFHAVPSGWKAVYRNVGTVAHVARPGTARLAVSDVPDILLDARGYLEGMCGTFSALLDIAETPGTVELVDVDPRRHRVEYEARWGRGLAT